MAKETELIARARQKDRFVALKTNLENTPPGAKEWLKSVSLVQEIQAAIGDSIQVMDLERAGDIQSLLLANSVSNLLVSVVMQDRDEYVESDLIRLFRANKYAKQSLQDLKIHGKARQLISIYGLSESEFNSICTRYYETVKEFGRTYETHRPTFSWYGYPTNPSKNPRVYLDDFSHISIKKAGNRGITIHMESPIKAGHELLSPPIYDCEISLTQGKPIAIDMRYLARGELHHELHKHPEVIAFLTDRFIEKVDRYTSTRDDNSTILPELYEFLRNEYLYNNLPIALYHAFLHVVELPYSPILEHISKLRMLEEYIINSNSHLYNTFEEETRAFSLITERLLTSLGCVLKDGRIENFFDIVESMERDYAKGRKMEQLWNQLVNGKQGDKYHNVISSLKRHNNETHAHIYASIYKRALELVRSSQNETAAKLLLPANTFFNLSG